MTMFFTIHESCLVVASSREELVSYASGHEDKTIMELIRPTSPEEVTDWGQHADGVIYI